MELKWTEADGILHAETGRTLLHCAVRANNIATVRQLLEQGVGKEADVFLKDADAATGERSTKPVMEAMIYARPQIVELLLDAGFDHEARTPQKSNAFHLAAMMNRVDNMSYWLQRFPDWNLNDPAWFGGSPLSQASGGGKLEAVQFLCERRANPNHITCHGQTGLALACWTGTAPHEIVKVLVSAKADVNIPSSAQDEATQGFFSNAINEFQKGSATLVMAEFAQVAGSTPLASCIRRRNLKSARVLLEARADVSVRDELGRSIWDIAKSTFRDAQLQEVSALLAGGGRLPGGCI
jgi:ankyrin repeat protein